MTPTEIAVLLRYGVVMDTIQALKQAGYTTLAQLADVQGPQLIEAGLTEDGARTVRRALGRLIDIGYSTIAE